MCPTVTHTSQAGPFDLWPTGLGFEYFYGFIGADSNGWNPPLFEGTKPIEPPHDAKNDHLDKDLADHAIARIRLLNAVAPDKPWLQYMMEVYAAALLHADHIGRIVAAIEELGKLDNTLVIYIQGDNGASACSGSRPPSTTYSRSTTARSSASTSVSAPASPDGAACSPTTPARRVFPKGLRRT
jgi:arylsulfatase A-like enzyme